jgi:hypothetical protein
MLPYGILHRDRGQDAEGSGQVQGAHLLLLPGAASSFLQTWNFSPALPKLTLSFSQGLPAPSCKHGILVLHYQS